MRIFQFMGLLENNYYLSKSKQASPIFLRLINFSVLFCMQLCIYLGWYYVGLFDINVFYSTQMNTQISIQYQIPSQESRAKNWYVEPAYKMRQSSIIFIWSYFESHNFFDSWFISLRRNLEKTVLSWKKKRFFLRIIQNQLFIFSPSMAFSPLSR